MLDLAPTATDKLATYALQVFWECTTGRVRIPDPQRPSESMNVRGTTLL